MAATHGPSDRPWRAYERLVATLQSDQHASDDITVIPNAKIVGALSRRRRQVDVLIDARVEEDVTRRVIVDAKLRKRPVDVKDVEMFEGMMRDCRAHRGILVCSAGWTRAALRRAQDAITISLVTEDALDQFDPVGWEPCLGSCASPRGRKQSSGWVLYDQPFGLAIGFSPLAVMVVGKCDGCGDFHVWCWECGSRFALLGKEAEHHCGCERFWLTAEEPEGTDTHGNELSAVLLILTVFDRPQYPIVVDRRPLR